MTPYRCVHGFTLTEPCRACDLDRARSLVNQWGGEIDEARKVIAESVNQCDGCRVGAPYSPMGNHQMPDGGFMGCTRDRYEQTTEEER